MWRRPPPASDAPRSAAAQKPTGQSISASRFRPRTALLLDFIAPESFTYWLSILFLVGSVFGGIASVWGAVAGGLLLQFWSDIAGMVSRDLVHSLFDAVWRQSSS